MKVAIYTQVRENYGDADAPHWKCKGGNTFVVTNLSVAQTIKIKESGIPTLKALIESSNTGFEEYIIDWAILDDDAKVCEEYETPTQLSWEQGRWVARIETLNGEYSYMRKEVAKRSEYYEMEMSGERKNYSVVYTMRDGRNMTWQQAEQYFKQAA